jgi:hypothetical protein
MIAMKKRLWWPAKRQVSELVIRFGISLGAGKIDRINDVESKLPIATATKQQFSARREPFEIPRGGLPGADSRRRC